MEKSCAACSQNHSKSRTPRTTPGTRQRIDGIASTGASEGFRCRWTLPRTATFTEREAKRGWERNMDDPHQKPEQPQDAPPPAPLTKEQLSGLLNSFLDQLIASKPPAPCAVSEPQDNAEQQQPRRRGRRQRNSTKPGWKAAGRR
jgi:hypothetical protein